MNKYLPDVLTGAFVFISIQFTKNINDRSMILISIFVMSYIIHSKLKQEQKNEYI